MSLSALDQSNDMPLSKNVFFFSPLIFGTRAPSKPNSNVAIEYSFGASRKLAKVRFNLMLIVMSYEGLVWV